MRPAALFVDCYGTLVQGDRSVIDAVVEAVTARTGLAATAIDRPWWQRFRALCAQSRGGAFVTQRELELRAMSALLRDLGHPLERDELAGLLEPLFRYWRTAAPYPDAVAFLRRWTSCHVVIVSNIDRADLAQVLPALPRVVTAVTSEDAGRYKPDPGVFRRALELVGAPADRVVHVGDSWESDVQGARRAGIVPVWLQRDAPGHASPGDVARIGSFDALPECLVRLDDPSN